METKVIKKLIEKYKNDILEPFDIFIEKIGIEGITFLTKEFGGSNLYIPKLRTILAKCIDKDIKKEFTGNNYKDLSKKYGFTERSIREKINMIYHSK